MQGQRKLYSFGEFTLDLGRGALLKAGTDVKLRPKSFAVLRLLVERHGQLVTKDELMSAVWSRVIVTDGALIQCLIDVRRAIEDESQTLVRTIPRRGYIFDAPVKERDDSVETAVAEPAGFARAGSLPPPDTAEPPIAWSSNRPGPSATTSALQRSFWRWGWVSGVAAIALLVVIGALSWRTAPPVAANVAVGAPPAARPPVTAPAAPRNSIAVLPFVNMSSEPDQEYFSDGISEEILNSLAQSPELLVIARTSSFAFKAHEDASVADIASKLNVAYVLEGSVRKSADQVRITAQLVNAADSSHLWSQTYDRDMQDTLAVQTDIATRVTDALKVQLIATGRKAPVAAAHDAYLRAKYFYHRRGSGDAAKSKAYFEEAVRIDPDYALAWEGVAGAYGIQLSEGTVTKAVWLEKSRQAIEKALVIDPTLPEVQLRAFEYYMYTDDAQRAVKHWLQAYALDRDDPAVVAALALLRGWQHRFDEWIALDRRLVSADPASFMVRVNFANHLLTAGHLQEARSEFLKAVELNPDDRPAVDVDLARILILERRYAEALEHVHDWLPGDDTDQVRAMAHDGLGRRAESVTAMQRLLQAKDTGNAVRLAEIYALRGDSNEAFRWIETAYKRLRDEAITDSPWLWTLNFSPFLVPLYADPRWEPLALGGLGPTGREILATLTSELDRVRQ